jgi:hypothetical protein
MRRVTIGLAIVLALSLMLAAVAIAAPPGGYCDIDENHPNCPTATTSTPPTTVPPTLQPCEDQFAVIGGREQVAFECEWAPQGNDPSTGTIAVIKVSGEVSHLVVMVRDSSPGDLCELSWPGKTSRGWEWYQGPLTGALDLTFPLTDDRGTYWAFDYLDNGGSLQSSTGAHWCGPYDPIDGLRDDLNGDPLHLRVILDGNKNKNKENASVSLTLSPVQEFMS